MPGIRGILVIGSACGLFAAAVAMQPASEQAQGQAQGQPQGQPQPGSPPSRGRNLQQPGGPLSKRREGEAPKGPVTREQLKSLIERHAGELDKRRESLAKLRERLEKVKGDEELIALQTAIQREIRGFLRENREPGAKPPGAERAEMMDVLRQSKPELAAKMAEFAKSYPAASGMIERLGVKPADFVRAKTDDPALFDLYSKQIEGAMSVAEHVHAMSELIAAGKGDTEAGKAKRLALREAVARHFETRAAVQSKDIEALKVRLERLQKQLGDQAAGREEAIDRWVNELIKKGGELGKGPEKPRGEKPK